MKWRVSIYRRMSYHLALGIIVELFLAEPLIEDFYFGRRVAEDYFLLFLGTTVLLLGGWLFMTNYPGKYYNYVEIDDEQICSFKIGKRRLTCVDLNKPVYYVQCRWKTRSDEIDVLVISNKSFVVPSNVPSNVIWSDHFDETTQVLLYMNNRVRQVFPKDNWINVNTDNSQDYLF